MVNVRWIVPFYGPTFKISYLFIFFLICPDHVVNSYLHLPQKLPKCRQIFNTRIDFRCFAVFGHASRIAILPFRSCLLGTTTKQSRPGAGRGTSCCTLSPRYLIPTLWRPLTPDCTTGGFLVLGPYRRLWYPVVRSLVGSGTRILQGDSWIYGWMCVYQKVSVYNIYIYTYIYIFVLLPHLVS